MMKYKAIGCLTFISSFAAAATSMPELLPRYPCFQEFELHQESHLIPNTFQIMRAACKGSVIDDPGPDVKNVAIKTVLFSGGSFSIDEKADPNWILTFTPDLQCKAENQVGETIETLVGGVHTKVEIHYGKPRRTRILSAKGPTDFQNPALRGVSSERPVVGSKVCHP